MSLRTFLLFLFSVVFCRLGLAQSKQAQVIEEAISLYQAGNSIAAIVLLENQIEKSPQGEFYELKSQIEEQAGMHQAALHSITNAMEISLDRWDLYFRRGLIFYNLGVYQEAIDDFSDFLNQNDGSTTAIFFRTDINDNDDLKIKTSNMVEVDAYMYRGLSYQAIDSLVQAEDDLLNAIKEDSTAALFLNLGLIKLDQGDSTSAKDALLVAIEIDPNYTLGWYNLKLIDPQVEIPSVIIQDSQIFPMLQYRALEALKEQDYELTKQLTKSLLRLYPNRTENYELAGRLAYEQGEFKSAIEYLHKGLALTDKAEIFYNLLGNAYFQVEEYKAAVSYYELLLATDPFNSSVGFNAAVAYHRTGDTDNMCRCLNNLQKTDFDNPQLTKMQNLCE